MQRVSRAQVTVAEQVAGQIGRGIVVFLGVQQGDDGPDIEYTARKCAGLRIFPDEQGRFDRSVVDEGLSALVISQFTLLGDVRRGRRPSFSKAMVPEEAELSYERFVTALRERVEPAGGEVATGEFQALMDVELVNEGPVTILLDSRKLF